MEPNKNKFSLQQTFCNVQCQPKLKKRPIHIYAHCRKLDEEDARGKMKEQDANEDGKVSWEEYLMAVYNFKKEDLVDMDKDKNPQMQQYADVSAVQMDFF